MTSEKAVLGFILLKQSPLLRIKGGTRSRRVLHRERPKVVAHNSPCFNVKVNQARIKNEIKFNSVYSRITLARDAAQSHEQ